VFEFEGDKRPEDDGGFIRPHPKGPGIDTAGDVMNEEKMCACGKPLHYSSPEIQRLIEEIVRDFGEDLEVVCGEHRWLVPRHFIALHGLKAWELPTLGFKEITDGKPQGDAADG
jgi:hypothetical protein